MKKYSGNLYPIGFTKPKTPNGNWKVWVLLIAGIAAIIALYYSF